jgi:hypothetical protein
MSLTALELIEDRTAKLGSYEFSRTKALPSASGWMFSLPALLIPERVDGIIECFVDKPLGV